MTSTRHGEARSALREVQSRHQDIQKIERTITELAQLFNEMSIMIEVQETAIDNIEQKAQETEQQMESGLQETDRAVKSARAARRKKWYCFGIIVLIISKFPRESNLIYSYCDHYHSHPEICYRHDQLISQLRSFVGFEGEMFICHYSSISSFNWTLFCKVLVCNFNLSFLHL